MTDNDLSAIVFSIHALEPDVVTHHIGRALHHFALSLIGATDVDLSEELHDSSEAKAYTVSGLMYDRQTALWDGKIRPGDKAWIRITGVNESVSRIFKQFVDSKPQIIEIDRHPWQVELTHLSPSTHPWAGQAAFQSLSRQAETRPPAETLHLEFALPTCFRNRGVSLPLPLPTLVFGSLADRWNAFAPISLPDLIFPFIEQNVVIQRFEMDTQLLTIKKGGKQIGFQGAVSFTILPKNPSLAKLQPELAEMLADNHDHLLRAVNMLANFAFYSGIGIKTTTGMGMVRRI